MGSSVLHRIPMVHSVMNTYPQSSIKIRTTKFSSALSSYCLAYLLFFPFCLLFEQVLNLPVSFLKYFSNYSVIPIDCRKIGKHRPNKISSWLIRGTPLRLRHIGYQIHSEVAATGCAEAQLGPGCGDQSRLQQEEGDCPQACSEARSSRRVRL